MKSWAKRTAVAALVTLAAAGAALAEITPGSEDWFRVMDVKLKAQELQLKLAVAAANSEDSWVRSLIATATAKVDDIFNTCESLLTPE